MYNFDAIRPTISALTVLAFLWSPAGARAAEAPEPTPPAGTLYLKSSPDAPAVEALHVATSLRAEVTGNVARVHVLQSFANEGDDWVEGLYVFPLSTDAAVDELQMRIGERTVRGKIEEKKKAQGLYEQARSDGRHAGIVDQQRPNLFSTAVANIAPHANVAIEITYLETIPYRDARYTLRLPLAITPRYTPDAASGPVTPERVTAPAQHVDISVELAPGFPVGSMASLHHQVQVSDDAFGKRIHLIGDQIAADRDFELVWTPAVGVNIATAAFAEQVGGDTFALLVLTPPDAAPGTDQPREVTFIIDTSGSMSGPSIEQAKAALQLGVGRLTPVDRFNIIRFASDHSALFAGPRPVSDENRAAAGRFIAGLQADGGTEMRPPLEQAMSTPPGDGYLQQIVFITDGSVGNEDELVALIHRQIGATRLFTVGIGAAPNSYFLQQAAAAGRGSYTFIAEREQVGTRMQDLFRKLESPALVDLDVKWPGGIAADLAGDVPGDVYAGDPLIILARLPRPESGTPSGTPSGTRSGTPSGTSLGAVTVSGRLQGVQWTRQVAIKRVSDSSGVSKLWARERIAELSRHLQFGGNRETLEQTLLDTALTHHLVSQLTSLVAVDDAVARPPGSAGHAEQAPTSAPAGSYWATTGFAKTATPAGLLLRFGALFLLGGLVLLGRFLLLSRLVPLGGLVRVNGLVPGTAGRAGQGRA